MGNIMVMSFSKSVKALVVFSLMLGSIPSMLAQNAQSGDLLKQVDTLVSFQDSDLSAEYLIVKKDPGGAVSTTKAAMFRRDRVSKFLILIIEPEVDKGKGYLKLGETLWLYDPVGKTFTFTNAKDRFQNSGARNTDFERVAYSENYRVKASSKEKLGAFDCTVLNLEATTDKVSFPLVKLWVSSDYLVRKVEDYSLSGQLMRITALPTYQKLGTHWLPSKMIIQDQLRAKTLADKVVYERTEISINHPSIKDVPDSMYTKEYLERVAR